ncbi:MAG: TonB-dependent receptor plug domain-containing protein [Candidatus Stygibacter frigidus]|nr:TonB-dependent receptor plug domain-containing protein [Candidatus Stygibacter frigidus]
MKTKLLLLIFCLLTAITLNAMLVSGYVIDAEKKYLDQVLVKSSADFDITGEDGIYQLEVNEQDTLIFHKLGYQDITLSMASIPAKLRMDRLPITISGIAVSERKYLDQQTVQHLKPSEKSSSENETLAGYLAAETGLQLSGTRTAGTRQALKIPGYDSRHTLVMLDGIPLNSAGEEFDFSRIPLNLISEIEIMPASGIAGSGAMGTVINLITQTPDKPSELETSFGYGSFDHYTASFKYSRLLKRLSLQTDLSYQQAENDFPYPAPRNWQLEDNDLMRENNSFWQADISCFFTYRSVWGDWGFKGYYTDFFRMLPGAVNNPDLFYKARISGDILKLQANWKYNWQNFLFITRFWNNSEKTIYDNTRLKEPYNQYLYYYIYGKNYKQSRGIKPAIEWEPNQNIKLKIGGEELSESYQYTETTYEVNSIPKIARSSCAIFSEAALNREWGDFTPWLKLAGRYDNAQYFSPEQSGSVSSGINYENEFLISASIDRLWGYTLPSFYSLYWKGDAEATGNPDLVPETSSGRKLEGNLQYLDNSFSVSWREDELQNMILWIQDFNYAWKPINLGAANLRNLEYRCNLKPIKNIKLSGIYTRTITADKTRLADGEPSAFYNKELIYTPDYQGNIAMNWSPGDFILNLNIEFTGNQWTTRDQLSDEKLLAEYELYNCSLGWKMQYETLEFTWLLQVNNLLDKHYYIYEYMPQPGRNLNLSIKIKYR